MALPNGLPQVSDLGRIASATVDPFQTPSLVSAPFTIVTDLNGFPRKISDPAKTVRPTLGIERIKATPADLVNDEVGPAGEQVWRLKHDDRVRFIGSWENAVDSDIGRRVRGNAGAVLEVTFYGTGLNLLTFLDNNLGDWRVSIDGGAEGPDIAGTYSGILVSRKYETNQILNLASGLTLGVHTVRLRHAAAGSTLLNVYGFEVLNASSDISVPEGTIYADGSAINVNGVQVVNYNSNFASGTPNGRGGRVVVYAEQNGDIKKALQPTESSALFLTSANHANEQMWRKINFREFGCDRTDDFSTLVDTVDDRYFTLGDGTTTLVGDNVRSFNNANFPEHNLYPNAVNNIGVTLTFVGTGLDVIMTFGSQAETTEVLVDGTLVGTIPYAALTRYKHVKIASGLPYGTHTVTIRRAGPLLSNYAAIHDFLIYTPKKPTIPSGTKEIGEYYLTANYDGSTITGTTLLEQLKRPIGTIQKANAREIAYNGTWAVGGANDVDNPSGIFFFTSTLNNFYEYTFWGTGIVVQHVATTTGTYTFEVQIDGVPNAAGVARSNVTNAGSGNYTTTTATINLPIRVEFTGLTLGLHTIRVTLKTAARNMGGGALHVITPVHFPGSNSLSPAVGIKDATVKASANIGEAKALINFDAIDMRINSSYNISSFVRVGTGQYIFYFERPFKDSNYYMAGSARRDFVGEETSFAADNHQVDVQELKPTHARVSFTYNSGAGSGNDFTGDTRLGTVMFFGELADEESD